jgi:hypothetical protein
VVIGEHDLGRGRRLAAVDRAPEVDLDPLAAAAALAAIQTR